MRPVLAVLAIAFIAASSFARADVWMWKDSAGEVHYSDRWVEGAERLKTVGPRPQSSAQSTGSTQTTKASTPVARLAAQNESADAARARENAARAVQQDVAKKQDEQCTKAKELYDKAISARRIYKTGKDGEKEFMSDADADQYRVKARADMDALCGTSPSP